MKKKLIVKFEGITSLPTKTPYQSVSNFKAHLSNTFRRYIFGMLKYTMGVTIEESDTEVSYEPVVDYTMNKENTVVVYTVEDLLNELSKENDRIGDFEPIQWLISQSGLNLKTFSGKIIFLGKHNPVPSLDVENMSFQEVIDKFEKACDLTKPTSNELRTCKEFLEWFLTDYQHGVETDKEQPNWSKLDPDDTGKHYDA